jgi:prepilin-type N-terminal cleavage/methylation domain-containing protein
VAWALQNGRPVRQRGFTLVEILVAVALIGILAAVAVLSFGKQTRKTRGSEVNAMFTALRVGQEQYHLENGTYLSTGTNEGDIFPLTPTKTEQTFLPMPATWISTRVDLPRDKGYCGYVVRTGRGGDGTNIGAKAVEFGLTAAPASDWYYLLARCDLDGSSTRDSYYFSWSGDTTLRKQNEGY